MRVAITHPVYKHAIVEGDRFRSKRFREIVKGPVAKVATTMGTLGITMDGVERQKRERKELAKGEGQKEKERGTVKQLTLLLLAAFFLSKP